MPASETQNVVEALPDGVYLHITQQPDYRPVLDVAVASVVIPSRPTFSLVTGHHDALPYATGAGGGRPIRATATVSLAAFVTMKIDHRPGIAQRLNQGARRFTPSSTQAI